MEEDVGTPKTILIMGAGRYQRAVIRRAKELGLRVAAVDRNPDAPGFRMADVAVEVDFADADAVLANVRGLEVDGVTTVQAERAVPVIARVAEELDLPGIGADTARLMTHKESMRRRLAETGVPQPRFTRLRTATEAPQAAATVGFPAVLKPVDASGQFGVFRVESLDELVARLPDTLASSPSGDALLEEYVEGIEMNGIVVVSAGEVRSVILCDRLHPPGPSFGVSWIHLFPPSLEGELLREAEQVAAEAALALGLETGIAFPQLLATPDGRIVLVECAARIGGMMAELSRHALGVDLLEAQLRIALGENVPDEIVRPQFSRPTVIRFLTASPGVLPAGRATRIEPIDDVLAAPGVVQADLYVEPGEVIRPVMRISDRRGYVIAVGETRDEAVARADAAAALVRVEVEPVGGD